MRGLLSETVNHKFSAEGIALWVPTLGSGLIDQSQKMTVAAMEMADMKVWAHRS